MLHYQWQCKNTQAFPEYLEEGETVHSALWGTECFMLLLKQPYSQQSSIIDRPQRNPIQSSAGMTSQQLLLREGLNRWKSIGWNASPNEVTGRSAIDFSGARFHTLSSEVFQHHLKKRWWTICAITQFSNKKTTELAGHYKEKEWVVNEDAYSEQGKWIEKLANKVEKTTNTVSTADLKEDKWII